MPAHGHKGDQPCREVAHPWQAQEETRLFPILSDPFEERLHAYLEIVATDDYEDFGTLLTFCSHVFEHPWHRRVLC